MKPIVIHLDGREVKVLAQKIGQELWVHYNGRTFTYLPEKSGRKASEAAKIRTGEIKAPMPGKVIKVKLPVGAEVKEGQVVIVMEAMKMEYSLEADKDGKVEKILCREGEQVNLGQLLAFIGDPA